MPNSLMTHRAKHPDTLAASGLRLTQSRRVIADILFQNQSFHFSAEEVAIAAKKAGHRLSLATVYNTLNDFAARGIIRQLSIAGGPTLFDTCTGDHHHFHVAADNRVIDIESGEVAFSRLPKPPSGHRIVNIDVVISLEKSTTPADGGG